MGRSGASLLRPTNLSRLAYGAFNELAFFAVVAGFTPLSLTRAMDLVQRLTPPSVTIHRWSRSLRVALHGAVSEAKPVLSMATMSLAGT